MNYVLASCVQSADILTKLPNRIVELFHQPNVVDLKQKKRSNAHSAR